MLFGNKRRLPPSPYPTRDPARILAMNEAGQQSGQPASQAVIEGQPGSARMPVLASQASGATPDAIAQPSQAGPLGSALREGFDYQAAAEAIAGDQSNPKWWQYAAAAIGDGLASHYGNGGFPAMRMLNQQQQARQQRLAQSSQFLARARYGDYTRQHTADLGASAPFTIGRNRMQYNPATGQMNTLYDGAEDFELYAQGLGLQPGTPEYFRAVEDHVLRSSGPSAHDRDIEMDDHRTGNDERMENLRYGNRRSLENLRQSHRRSLEGYRQGNRMQLRQTPSAGRGSRGSRSGGEMPTFRTPSEARSSGLPSGARFRDPSGTVRRIP